MTMGAAADLDAGGREGYPSGVTAETRFFWYRYTFTFDDGVKKVFEVRLDSQTLAILPPETPRTDAPAWTRLMNHRCGNCPFAPETTPHCPIALNLIDLVESFGNILSYEEADVLVEMAERNVFKRVPVQRALSSLMGIYMSAGGCPVMDVFKPLVRFHLPFSSAEETSYRVTTMYVMAQHLRIQSGLSSDLELNHVGKIFEEVHQVNVGFCRRLAGAIKQDALINSVSILDVFANMGRTPTSKRMAALRQLFQSYLKEAD